MLLLINVFITNQRNKKLLPDDRFDVFKYQLASMAVMEWDRAIIYCRLDNEYESRTHELRKWIDETFTCPVEFYPYRNIIQIEWQKTCDYICGKSSDNLIWILTNDDHVFIDSNLDMINEGKELLKKEPGNASLYWSHWLDNIRWFAGKNATKIGNHVVADRNVADGVQLVTEKLLRSWFFDLDLGNNLIKRSDDVMLFSNGGYKNIISRCYLPLKEIGYHMEGYMQSRIPYDICPIRNIPPGFFDKQIKISYCRPFKEDRVNIDPRLSFNETNYKILIDDIPMFWKNRIAEINDGSQENLIGYKRQHIRNMCSVQPKSAWKEESDAFPPDNWFIE